MEASDPEPPPSPKSECHERSDAIISATGQGPHQEVLMASPQHNAPLESLPPEIRRQILATLEYGELGALVHASPVYH
ncbi:hypothetical protein VTK26DRAFT_4957 [Humicola hyalothermophila]